MNRTIFAFATLVTCSTMVVAQERDYTEGTVTEVAAIDIVPGNEARYMKYLRTEWKPEQEALKKAGVIVDYAVYATAPRAPGQPDLYLTVTYANMAAMDGRDDRIDKVLEEISGDREKVDAGVVDRNSYRTILGTELIRELVVK